MSEFLGNVVMDEQIGVNGSLNNKKQHKSDLTFRLIVTCFILSFATQGFGSTLFGYSLYTDVSTLFIYFAIVIQVTTGTLRFPKILASIFTYIIIQTFIFNFFNISFVPSVKHLIGLLLFSFSTFSFVSVYRFQILTIIRIYYKFVFVVTALAIFQTMLFVFFGISFIPQNIISGALNTGGNRSFSPEIFDVIPRAFGLSSEPAHYAIMILPGVFISILVLLGRAEKLEIQNKAFAWIILIGFILSFSLVGYFGLVLCLLSIFANNVKGKSFTKVFIALFFAGAFYFVSQTNLMVKVTSLPTMFTGISNYQYTSSDLTGFALASNLLVARAGLIKSNYLGTGLNTHKETYDATIYNLLSASQVILELNKGDAGSLFIRLPSEFGLPGILAFILFLYHYRIKNTHKSSQIRYINSMCFVILISYAARDGGYLNISLWLFLALYYYTYIVQQKQNELAGSNL